jgi:hypothetical protein
VDKLTPTAPEVASDAVVLAEPTCHALGLPPSQPTPRREVVTGALGLLDPDPVSELAENVDECLDDLIVGVVEAVQECVLTPPPDGPDLRARAEVEAASWVDDFIADDAPHDEAVAAQQAMFQLACLVADAVAEALTARTRATDRPTKFRCLRVATLDPRRVVEELRRRAVEAVRWSVQRATPIRCLHR